MTISLPELTYPGPQGAEDPWPLLRRLRDEAPMLELPYRPGVYMATRYADVRRILGDAKIFSSSGVRSKLSGFNLINIPSPEFRVMNETDDPEHAGKRQIAFAPLKPGRLKSYEPMILEITDRLIDSFIDDGRMEFCSRFAAALPSKLTCRLMGVGEDEEAFVMQWGKFESSGLWWMDDVFKENQKLNSARMVDYLTDKLRDRYEHPRDDVFSAVIKAQVDRDGEFRLEDVRGQVAILLGGGIVTTAHFLSSLMLLLLSNPDQLDKIRSNPSLIANMTDEGLRLEPPSMWQPRHVLSDVEFGDVTVPAGSFILMMFASANRDERQFDEPERFDVERPNAREHLSFGYGPHFCLGAPLARIEIRIAIERLLTRLTDIRFADGNDFSHIRSASFRGLQRLDLEFSPG